MAPPTVEVPNRPIFSASEVCAIAAVRPFVLRSWERAFPSLGGTTPKGGRAYRRDDVKLVLTIKRLLLEEGLTLDAVRAKLDGDEQPSDGPARTPIEDLLGQHARARIDAVKTELRAILASLASDGASVRKAGRAEKEQGSDAKPSASAAGRAPARPRKGRGASEKRSGASS